ncbi:hypothetical protein HLH17_01100 [Acinetobacter sp. ANC 5380]|uniref:Uncharacterized protein n=1 Tax=Acinetobacter terrae TaxID=2731247 RepID=A0A7Y2RCK1_9GAMM|nr:hypothetical protein [Acinetobacter terrae]NNH39447.1 hypothetical protein [Acinetobacter terrae]NNH76307.1 hypothetical protein [Acinetobacter terrae]
MSSLISGSSNIDIGAIAGLVGNLIGGLIGGSSNIDVGALTDLLGSLSEDGSNGIDLSGLLGNPNNGSTLDFGGIIEGAGQLIGDTPIALLSVADLLQGNSSLGNIDLGNIIPGTTDSTQQILGNSTLPSYDATSLPPSTPNLELDQPIVFG